MAAVRIRGTWYLSLSVHTDDIKSTPLRVGDAQLVVQTANRTGIGGELHIGGESLAVAGKIKPGSPAVVSITEAGADGLLVQDGVEAILYIPPWWPSVKYQHDLITGTMVVGASSSLRSPRLAHKIILVSGVQPFE
ncbi:MULTISPECIES: hypothetical protein [Burkholderia]|uniref:Uncharacterized protein n=1 Tax=Burkholderia sola TaxID=2843302 RepID=A0ABV2C2A6_9BURK|nr:hypothetical protein [Burkholderia sp. CpTa8-5]MBP0713961.1 hypothetical protein [Burkholderia sp. AcTa6-5]CAG2366158.1 hypothetical protein BCCR75389_06321 [Burkholderia cenocepacia]CAG2366310.1 hypothetical protein BCCR12632_06359 [Burkholderia cenocepacia]CAG2366324.1 hypothetical protein BCCR75384_06354 [Burkholderia cenocepacia]CAG2366325.1 hypothetical protein BCCR75388_06352 [Burkholderia cenocepacia]